MFETLILVFINGDMINKRGIAFFVPLGIQYSVPISTELSMLFFNNLYFVFKFVFLKCFNESLQCFSLLL